MDNATKPLLGFFSSHQERLGNTCHHERLFAYLYRIHYVVKSILIFYSLWPWHVLSVDEEYY